MYKVNNVLRCVKKVAQFCLLRVWSFKLNKKNRFRNWHIFHPLHLLVPNSLQLVKLLRLGSGRKFECKLGLSDLPLQRYPTLTSTPIFIILLLKCSLGYGSLLFNHDLSIRLLLQPLNPVYEKQQVKQNLLWLITSILVFSR